MRSIYRYLCRSWALLVPIILGRAEWEPEYVECEVAHSDMARRD
jgi:hypothetical protein